MKVFNIIEGVLTPEQQTNLLKGLGGRPEQFKYVGPSRLWIHWTEAESWSELRERLEKLKIGEFCVSSLFGGEVINLTGLIFKGKPRFLFPVDVHSVFNPDNGLRYVISAEKLKTRTASIMYKNLHAKDPTELEIKSHDEAWCSMEEMQFVGVAVGSYEMTPKEFLQQTDNATSGQLHSLIGTMTSVVKANVPLFFVGKTFIHQVTQQEYHAMVQRVQQ